MRHTILFLLILLATPLFSQSSSAPSSGSMICFTESELDAMEAEAAKIMEEAVVEAVNSAVAPYRIVVLNMQSELDAKSRTILFWKITTGVGAGLAVVFAVLLAVSHLMPPVP